MKASIGDFNHFVSRTPGGICSTGGRKAQQPFPFSNSTAPMENKGAIKIVKAITNMGRRPERSRRWAAKPHVSMIFVHWNVIRVAGDVRIELEQLLGTPTSSSAFA